MYAIYNTNDTRCSKVPVLHSSHCILPAHCGFKCFARVFRQLNQLQNKYCCCSYKLLLDRRGCWQDVSRLRQPNQPAKQLKPFARNIRTWMGEWGEPFWNCYTIYFCLSLCFGFLFQKNLLFRWSLVVLWRTHKYWHWFLSGFVRFCDINEFCWLN